jgi:alpha-ketoglutarate-dependent taurine dioxygenase
MNTNDRPVYKPPPSSGRRHRVALSPEQLVVYDTSATGRDLPRVIRPANPAIELDLARWIEENRAGVNAELHRAGGILFRGFPLRSAADFHRVMEAWGSILLPYTDHATPRHQISEHIYSSTDYPADQAIELHNECAYARRWPLRVFFFCMKAAEAGGETPIADCRKILGRLRPETIARFASEGVMYVRNFGDGLGLPWSKVFGTDDLSEVAEACRRADIELEDKGNGRLRTRQRRGAILSHPNTGETSWFNQVTAFHISSVEPATRAALLSELGEDEVPKNSFYGDGSPIEPATLEEIRQAYQAETVTFSWQRGDLLVLDNVFVAHGRAPYKGARQILVGMAEPC